MALSKNHRSRLNRAIKLAHLSEARHRHGAAIYKGGSLISVGVNVVKNSAFIIGDAACNPKCHAETMAIKAAGQTELSGATIYVARINRTGLPLYSRPCYTCMEAISQAGIKKIVYTVDNEEEVVVR